MRRNFLLFLCLLGSGRVLLAEAAAPAIPEGFPADRYRPVWVRSPFTIATPAEAQASGEWTLAGLAENGSRPLLFLVNRQNQERMIVTDQPNEKGFSVDTVDYRTDLLQSSARIKTPADTVTVRFDAASAAAPATPLPPQGQAAIPVPNRPAIIPGGVPAPASMGNDLDRRRRVMPHIVVPNPLPPGTPHPPAATP